MTRQKLVALAENVMSMRVRVAIIGSRNIYGLTSEEKVELDIDFHIAEKQFENAQRKYDEAVSELAQARVYIDNG